MESIILLLLLSLAATFTLCRAATRRERVFMVTRYSGGRGRGASDSLLRPSRSPPPLNRQARPMEDRRQVRDHGSTIRGIRDGNARARLAERRGIRAEVTREELAREIAEKNERCGHVESDSICLLPREHAGSHTNEPISNVIPIN